MTYWYIGDEESEDPRFRAVEADGCGMYHMAGSWCMSQVRGRPESDIPIEWLVPDHWVRGWPNGSRTAAKLVKHALWQRVQGGYRFAWLRNVNEPDAVRTIRKRERDKKRRSRSEQPQ
jgi:hypothetical protein